MISKELALQGGSHLLITCGRLDEFMLLEIVILDNSTMDRWEILGLTLCGFFAHVVWIPY